ncbi:hypothetical protein F511_28303 [Dorcoceras hygrometricum]|uniref:Uncharacterized protein n=1 Tax=Dorcoceras hygrometricum TaxID=472368 RepID=A0A2Z7AAL5_9LAMI|nr:hypothetical protein F511_28303 [Dorcoceras hygrometricum]
MKLDYELGFLLEVLGDSRTGYRSKMLSVRTRRSNQLKRFDKISSRCDVDVLVINEKPVELIVASTDEQENDIRTATEDDQQQLRNLFIFIPFRSGGNCGRYRQSGPRSDTRLLCHLALEGVTKSARTDSPRRIGRKQFSGKEGGGAHGGGGLREERGRRPRMPPRRRGRGRGQFQEDSEGQNEDRRSFPSRERDRQGEEEVDELAARMDSMELVMARFQCMSPQVFNGDESSEDADSWLQHIMGLFNRVQYDDELKLSLTTFQLRKGAERWWRGASRTLEETGVGISWDSLCGDLDYFSNLMGRLIS